MLRSTASKISEFLKQPCAEIPLAALVEQRSEFRKFLVDSLYTLNSIHSYMSFARMLIKKAEKLGWKYVEPELPEAWKALYAAAGKRGVGKYQRSFARQWPSPSNVSEDGLYDWVRFMVQRGGSYDENRKHARGLRKILVNAGFTSNLSEQKVQKPNYATSENELPAMLRQEIENLMKWKTAKFVLGRPTKARIREITASSLRSAFRRIHGFATNVEGLANVSSIRGLLQESIVSRFMQWALEERLMEVGSLRRVISALSGAFRDHPDYSDLNIAWIQPLLRTLPEDDPNELQLRKESKYLPHATLAAIPGAIRANRSAAARRGSKDLAIDVRDELLMKWLVTLPWRQRNIRECRIFGSNANLFKAKISTRAAISKPRWVQEAEQQNPDAEFWQFRFAGEETKTGNSLHCVLPLKLVGLLEDYIQTYRKELVRDSDPRTLFLNEDGCPIERGRLTNLVSELTLRHGGRVVTPHMFRDCFAYMWLEKFPEDFLTLSKLLWHRNIQTTITKYGARFNESTALCRMEDKLP